MTPPRFTRVMVRGDDESFRFQVIDSDTLLPLDTSAYLGFWVTSKYQVADADPGVIVLTLGAGITAIDDSQGLYEFTYARALTEALTDRPLTLPTDIQAKTDAAKIHTLAVGTIVVMPQVEGRS